MVRLLHINRNIKYKFIFDMLDNIRYSTTEYDLGYRYGVLSGWIHKCEYLSLQQIERVLYLAQQLENKRKKEVEKYEY